MKMKQKPKAILMLFFAILMVSFLIGDTTMTKEEKLTEYVTKQGGTEKAFDNAYWDNKDPGIYVDANTGKPLFSSLDKYDSGTGWPSFTKPIDESLIERVEDNSLGMKRIEIRTNESHLGHVFDDGPDGGIGFVQIQLH